MANVRVILMTCEKYSWCLRPFSYLFNIYWSAQQHVIIGGARDNGYNLPRNFSFLCEKNCNYGPNKWSDSLIDTLKAIHDEIVVIMLEDYFLTRMADYSGINTLADYMASHPDVVRLDLTTDRLYGGGMHDVEAYGHYDLIACPPNAPYQMSLQAGLWNRRNLLNLLVPGKSSWETEIHTDMANSPYKVFGTRQYPLRYANIVFKGKIAEGEVNRIPEPHRTEVLKWFPKGWEKVKNYG